MSGVDRWRPGTVIPVHNCAGADWDQGLHTAITNWSASFTLATMQPDSCAFDESQGVFIHARYEAPAADGSTWHGQCAATNHDRDGYLCYALIFVNDYWYRDYTADDPARAALLCHELGHALGAPHAPAGSGGCLQVPPPSEHIDEPGPWTIANLIATYTAPLEPIGTHPPKRKKHHASKH